MDLSAEKKVKQKKHRTTGLILMMLVILAVTGWFTGEQLRNMLFPEHLEDSMVVWNEEDVYRQEELILFADRNEFQVGEQGSMKLTVLCGESVTGPVTITDEEGNEVAVLENDGSGQLVTTVGFQSQEPRCGYLTAAAEEVKSAPVSFFIVPEITEEMSERLFRSARIWETMQKKRSLRTRFLKKP